MRAEIGEILLINPNTNPATTSMLSEIASEHLFATRAAGRIRLRAVSVARGPTVIIDEAGLHAAEPQVLACARREVHANTMGIVVGAIGDPGVTAVRTALTIPVIGIGEAAVRAAAHGGRRFGIVTTTPLLVGSLQALGRLHGTEGTFTGVRLTDSSAHTLAADPPRQLRELERACRFCHDTDRAEAVVIGGGPLGSSARTLATALDMVVVQPIPSAVDHLLDCIDAHDVLDVL